MAQHILTAGPPDAEADEPPAVVDSGEALKVLGALMQQVRLAAPPVRSLALYPIPCPVPGPALRFALYALRPCAPGSRTPWMSHMLHNLVMAIINIFRYPRLSNKL